MLSNIRVADFEFFVPLNEGGAVSAPYPMRGCSGLTRAEISPALCRMIGCNRFTEHLLEVIGGELEIALCDGDMRMTQRLLHEVNIASPEILLQGEGGAQAVQ